MNCPGCGNELEESESFCTGCGEPVASSGGPPRGRAALIVAVVLAALLVLGGAAVLVVVLVTGGPGLTASVEELDLRLSDGGEIDVDNVPLGELLVFEVKYIAQFGEGGGGTLAITLYDGDGEEVLDETFKVRSGDVPQSRKYEYSMKTSEGETFEMKVSLEVDQGTRTVFETGGFEYYVAEGSVDGQDSDGEGSDEAESELQECRENMAGIETMLFEFFSEEGNYPDDMSQLGALPECPSGGYYSYIVDVSTEPPGLEVTCTVHGKL